MLCDIKSEKRLVIEVLERLANSHQREERVRAKEREKKKEREIEHFSSFSIHI